MSLIEIVGLGLLVVVGGGLLLARTTGERWPLGTLAHLTRVFALVFVLITASVLVWDWWRDSGLFGITLIVIALTCSVLPLALLNSARWKQPATWGSGLVLLAMALVTGLGGGFVFIIPAVALLGAAALDSAPRAR